MTATFHPGVTNCGGSMAASGCSCARTVGAEALDVDLMDPAAPAYDAYSANTWNQGDDDFESVRVWAPTLEDEQFAALAEHVVTCNNLDVEWAPGAFLSKDFGHLDGPINRVGSRKMAAIVLAEARFRAATDVPGSEGFDDRARFYEGTAHSLFLHAPERLGSPTTLNEARGLWKGAQVRAMQRAARAFFPGGLAHTDPTSDPDAVRFAVEDPECARNAIEMLRTDADTEAGEPTAGHRQFTLRLAASTNRDVRAMVADAVSWKDDLLPVMANDHDPTVRAVIAGRMSHLKDRFEKDTELQSHHGWTEPNMWPEAVTQRKALTEISQGLARDPDTDVRRALATSQRWADEKTPRILADDRDPMVRNLLAANAGTSSLDEKAVKTLAKDREPGVRESLLASGVEIPERYLKRLSRDREHAVATLASNRLRSGGQVTSAGTGDLFIQDGQIQQSR